MAEHFDTLDEMIKKEARILAKADKQKLDKKYLLEELQK